MLLGFTNVREGKVSVVTKMKMSWLLKEEITTKETEPYVGVWGRKAGS